MNNLAAKLTRYLEQQITRIIPDNFEIQINNGTFFLGIIFSGKIFTIRAFRKPLRFKLPE